MKSFRNVSIAVAIMLLAAAAAAAQAGKTPEPKTLYTVMEVSFKEKNISVDIRYPQFNNPALDKLLKDKAVSGLDTFLKDAREYQAGDAQNEGEPRKYALFVDFTIHMLNADVISITYDAYVDYAGAHPTTMMSSLAADFRTGAPITLNDLFVPNSNYLSTISDKAIAGLMATLQTPDKEMVDGGAGPKPENYSVFYFRQDQIVFVFNPYQVASYAEGPQEYVLNLWEEPYSNIVKPDTIKKLNSAF